MSDTLTPNSETPAPSEQSSPASPGPDLNQLKASGSQAWHQITQLGVNLKLLLGGAVLTFIATFFPSYGFNAPYYNDSFNNFANLGWLSWLAALLVIILVLLPIFKVKIPMPWPTTLVYLILSGISLAAAVIQLITYLFDGTQWGGPQIGIFLVLLGTALMTYSAYNEQKKLLPPTEEQNPASK